MKIVRDPYKRKEKQAVGGWKPWVIPTDKGLVTAHDLAATLGLTPSQIHIRISTWRRGKATRDSIAQPPRSASWGKKVRPVQSGKVSRITADPYKSSEKNTRGGRAWIIPTDMGELPAWQVAEMIGITIAAIHARLWRWERGNWGREELLDPPRKPTKNSRRGFESVGEDADPESVCEIPAELWGSLAYLNGRRAPREYRLRAILVGSWERERGCRV